MLPISLLSEYGTIILYNIMCFLGNGRRASETLRLDVPSVRAVLGLLVGLVAV